MQRRGKKGRRWKWSTAMRPTDARYKLWRSMRVLTRSQAGFTNAELCVVADAKQENVMLYLRALIRAGYVARVRSMPGRGGAGFYTLLKDTGPNAPRLSHDGSISDLNLEGKDDDNLAG